MHERNIYRIPPNFSELAKKHPFLAQFLTLSSKGAPKINFKDQAALRALTKALLLEDFQLDVEIPENVLIPTVPLRLNYILWLEDLLLYNDGFGRCGREICGLDVGSGATAVYDLLAARKNQWSMIGSEIDPESVMLGRSNVQRNQLGQLIQIKHVRDSILKEVLVDAEPGKYDFTMCNPPFFGSEDEADSISKSRKERPDPSGAKTGTVNELIASGGELEFIYRMMDESKTYSDRAKIFTTMIGIKRHLKDLISKLKSVGVQNYTTTEFSQGKTMRWGLAWSFNPKIHLTPAAQVTHVFENLPGCLNFENYIFTHLKNLNFKCLEWITSQDESDMDLGIGQKLHFIATENTWTGQRRKRREMKRLEEQLSDKSGEEPPKKMIKMSDVSSDDKAMESGSSSAQVSTSSEKALLDSHVEILREGSRATINMQLRGGTMGKDELNQIMTFLKNSFNRDARNPATELHQLLQCQ